MRAYCLKAFCGTRKELRKEEEKKKGPLNARTLEGGMKNVAVTFA